jgi:hypothetical protein
MKKIRIQPATASCGPPIRWIYRPLLASAAIAMSSCGGTFTLRPDGSLAYTTPEILKPVIIREK